MPRRRHRYRHHYHDCLKQLVKETGNEELIEKFNELEKKIDAGEFYPERIQKVREDIAERLRQGKGPLSLKGIRLIQQQSEEEKYNENLGRRKDY